MPDEPRRTEHLLADARNGNDVAVEDLIQRYLPEIRAYVRLNANGAIRAKESCSDLVQTVCKDVLRNIDQFEYRGEDSFKGWLYVTVLNKIRMRERHYHAAKRSLERETPHGAEALNHVYATVCSPSQHAIAREELERVERAFDQLSPEYCEVLTLTKIAGLSIKEAAARMERTQGSVKMLLSRAIARLVSVLDVDAEPNESD